MTSRQPVLFLSHGSPMTALGGDALADVWARLAEGLTPPAAVLVISAHWDTQLPVVGGSPRPETIHDFGGFPEALYRLRYPAPGAPTLAQAVKERLKAAGIAAGIDASRGLDHGAWVPLAALFPAADIPVVPLSVQADRCARHHYALGAALAPLVQDNVLIVASGHMTHNLRDFIYASGGAPTAESRAFRDWTHERVMHGDHEALFDWARGPGARAAHPTPEHFLPIFVALGAAGTAAPVDWLDGGWVGGVLAADGYRFDPAR